MTGADEAAPRGGLAYVLGATVVAGGIGYVIQALVPAFTSSTDYLAFSIFWSAVYLSATALSGIQQEITRASTSQPDASGWRFLAGFTLACAGIAAVVIVATGPLWAGRVFVTDAAALVVALAVAAVGYTLVAGLSGALYGVRNWPGVAGMTVADSALRLIAIVLALAAGAGVVGLGWAVALPFLVAVILMWALTGAGVRRRLALDTGFAGLARNSARTVAASVASGLLISGLPFLLGLTSSALPSSVLASLILVLTLTRAPLVIPLLALQSYLVVTFRDAGRGTGRRVLLWGGGLVAVTAVLAAVATFVGPWVVSLLYADRYELPAYAYAAIVAGAGLTGLLCITGPAVLAAGRHSLYLAGWAAASVATIAYLLIRPATLPDVLAALVVGPMVGVVVHAVGWSAGRGRVSG